MARYVAYRSLRALITIWIVVTLVFIGLRLSGDPAQALLGPEASSEAVAALRQAWGIDEPLAVQYTRYLQQLARGDFGRSLRDQRPATVVVHERIPSTLRLASAALAIALSAGTVLGTLAALRAGSLLDRTIVALSAIGQGIPNFVLGLLLILLFALHLGWFPTSGQQGAASLVLPALTLSSFSVASLTRFMRSALLEVLRADYVRTAHAKGLPWRTVLIDHMGRNAALTLVTVISLQVAVAIAGAVVTETVFSWPGMGQLLARAAELRDFPVVQYGVLLIVASVVLVNLLTDILYGWLDPRVRLEA
jgi:peptide/nickel transport system permease protein